MNAGNKQLRQLRFADGRIIGFGRRIHPEQCNPIINSLRFNAGYGGIYSLPLWRGTKDEECLKGRISPAAVVQIEGVIFYLETHLSRIFS